MPYQIYFLDCHDFIQIFCRRFQEDCSYYLPFHQPVVNIQNSSSPGGYFWKLLTKKSLKKMLFESTNLANLTRNGFRWSSPYSCICWQWSADKGMSCMLHDPPWSSWYHHGRVNHGLILDRLYEQVPVKAYTRFGPLVAREVGEEQLDFDEVWRPEDEDQKMVMMISGKLGEF